ncbi:MAG: SDR family oxidoreductase [Nitrospiria bacterium]
MSKTSISPEGKVALVSGANRGIGKAITIALLENGARKVYAGARDVATLNNLLSRYMDRLIPLELDVCHDGAITKAAEIARDVNILVNNAGVLEQGGFFAENTLTAFKKHLEVNVWGLVKLSHAFINILKTNRPASIVNISSIAGLGNMPVVGTYSASKAAVHSITQGMRAELAAEDILVMGVYPGPIDTDMARGVDFQKDTPENVANNIIQAFREGSEDVFPDIMSAEVGSDYMASPKEIEKTFAEYRG